MKKLKPIGSVLVNVPAGLCRVRASGENEEFEIDFPLEQFLVLAGRAQQESRAYNLRMSIPAASVPLLQMPAMHPDVIEIATVWTTTPPSIAVVFDRGTPGELAFSFPIDVARSLGKNLMARAAELQEGD